MGGLEKTPDDLPVPLDDGAADHLSGAQVPAVSLAATNGHDIDLGLLEGVTVFYAYPMTGVPGTPLPDGWDEIPGARGCTPQSCAFRDHFAELKELGVNQVFGISTQTPAYQREAAERLYLPFPLLSDHALVLQKALRLPTLQVEIAGQNNTLLKRLALVVRQLTIVRVFYPVFPPDRNAGDVLEWLRKNPA